MSKKIWYWIGGLVLIIIIVCVLMSGNKSASINQSAKTSDNVTAAVAQQTLHNLISSGTIQTCTFSISASATSSKMSGTLFMDTKNMKGDFTITDQAGKINNAHMMVLSGIDYLWTDAIARGVKLPWSVAASSTSLSGRLSGIDMNQPTNYSCTKWTPDQSVFILPSTVQFTDISALMKMQGKK